MMVRKVVGPNQDFSSVWYNSLLTSDKILLLKGGGGIENRDQWHPMDYRIGDWKCLVYLEKVPIE